MTDFKRYAAVYDKFPREVVLLRSAGCRWNKCAFCDYKLDFDRDGAANAAFNRSVLDKVQGCAGNALQVIDSASFDELPDETVCDIISLCGKKNIGLVIAEQHFNYRLGFPALRERFERRGISCKFIVGLETFDGDFREKILKKGMGYPSAGEIAAHFEWANLLFGLKGQTLDTLTRDIELGLSLFERVTVNVFVANSTPFERDSALVEKFYLSRLFDGLKDNPSVEILDVSDGRAPDKLGGVGYPESEAANA
ncbi:MAG: hypothetical protein LBQ40_07145 [Clostridiales bacterium]|jgi:hypothetical protein|nr:hypothetical protein [Clostridiales bacterium]